jgi:hypothetical protein
MKAKLVASGTLIALSPCLYGGLTLYKQVYLHNPNIEGPTEIARIVQNRENLTASTSPMLKFPTRTTINISFPKEMAKEETRRISVILQKDTEFINLFSEQASKEQPPERLWKAIDYSSRDMEIQLISSAFEVQGLSKTKAGTPYPLRFDWTITPKLEGRHELLLGLSDVAEDARGDSGSRNTTNVRIADQKIELRAGVGLPIEIKVTGLWGLPTSVINVALGLPGLAGFILSYPLFVDKLRDHINVRVATKAPQRGKKRRRNQSPGSEARLYPDKPAPQSEKPNP